MHSTLSLRSWLSRRHALKLGGAAALSGCVGEGNPVGPPVERPRMDDGYFVMRDGTKLPFRTWLPEGRAQAVVLALHGFNDSRDAWEIPAPEFAAAGIAVYAPDQRGFGDTPGRGLWPGADVLADDGADMVAVLRRLHPAAKLVGMGESMGGAVLMHMATRGQKPDLAGYVMVAPAVWGRARMNFVLRSSLWLAATLVPGMAVTRPPAAVRVTASDNIEALRRLSSDPLTIHSTRFDTLRGLVDLMDAALAAAPQFDAPGLFLYGARDELVPPAATAATWRALTPGRQRFGYYPNGWHLLMRDLGRAAPIGDAIAWVKDIGAPLPSDAESAARGWLQGQA